MSVCFLPLCDLELYPRVSPIRSSLKTPCYISKVLRGEQWCGVVRLRGSGSGEGGRWDEELGVVM